MISQRGRAMEASGGWRAVISMTLRCFFSHRKGKIKVLDHLILIILINELQVRGGRNYSLLSKNMKLNGADTALQWWTVWWVR